VAYFADRVNYWVRCRGCKREIAIVVEIDGDDGRQTKILSRTFHTLSECSHCHERHFYDYSDMMNGQKPEPALPV
jgi:hypothetical protein